MDSGGAPLPGSGPGCRSAPNLLLRLPLRCKLLLRQLFFRRWREILRSRLKLQDFKKPEHCVSAHSCIAVVCQSLVTPGWSSTAWAVLARGRSSLQHVPVVKLPHALLVLLDGLRGGIPQRDLLHGCLFHLHRHLQSLQRFQAAGVATAPASTVRAGSCQAVLPSRF